MNRKMSRSKGFIGAIILLLAIIVAPTIRTSTAQESAGNDDCWTKIVDCSDESGGILQCCPLILEAISDDRPCFCTIQDVVRDNATLVSSLASILTSCGESTPLDTLCPDEGPGSAPTPSGNLLPSPVSPPSSDSSLTPLPSPTSTNLSPTETPASLPPAAEDEDLEESTACMRRIMDCTNATQTTPGAFISECCPLIKQEIANERECFCGFKEFIRENPSSATGFTQLFFKICSIPGSFDTLCPESPPLSPSDETVSFPPSDEESPTSPTIDTVFAPPPPDTISNSDGVNGSSKIAVSVGLLLLINMIICMFIV